MLRIIWIHWNEELLNEIKKSIEELTVNNEQQPEFKTSNSINECIVRFEKFAKTYR